MIRRRFSPTSFTRVKSSSFDILSLFNILFLQAVRRAKLRGALLLKYSLDGCIVHGFGEQVKGETAFGRVNLRLKRTNKRVIKFFFLKHTYIINGVNVRGKVKLKALMKAPFVTSRVKGQRAANLEHRDRMAHGGKLARRTAEKR